MTDTNDAVITEALGVIDKALAQMMRRELVSSVEITDVLLDVRSLLTMPPAPVASDAAVDVVVDLPEVVTADH